MNYKLQKFLQWQDFEFNVLRSIHENDLLNSHSHEFHELVFVSKGEAIHCLDNNQHCVKAGDVFLITPHYNHSYRHAKIQIYNILFSENFLKRFEEDLTVFPNYQLLFCLSPDIPLAHRLLSLESKYFPKCIELLDDIIKEQNSHQAGSRSAIYSDFLRLFILICRHSHPYETPQNHHYAYQISRLVAILDKDYAKSWNLEQMAQFVNMSISNFRQQFKKLIGKSPNEYLLDLRLEKAEKMLFLNNKTISEISLLCGFSDSNYFSRIFKSRLRVSPVNYRKNLLFKNSPLCV